MKLLDSLAPEVNIMEKPRGPLRENPHVVAKFAKRLHELLRLDGAGVGGARVAPVHPQSHRFYHFIWHQRRAIGI